MAQTETTEGMRNGKAKGQRRNQIGGFLVDKISRPVMLSYIEEHGLELDVDVDDEQLALALALHFKKTVAKEQHAQCDVCQGISSIEPEVCPVCPFCGDAGEAEGEEDEDEELLVADAPESAPVVEEPESEDELEADDDEEDEEEDEDAPPPPTVAKSATKAKKKEEHMSMGETTNGAATKKKGLAKTSGGLLTERDLDKAVADVTRLKGAAAEGYWLLGKKLLEINVKQLWKLRLKEDGKQRFASFDAFVLNECNMTPTHAYNAIDVAREYETPEEVRELGHTKAALLLKAAPEDRERLKEKVKAGATKRDLEKDVAESRKKHGSPKKSHQARGGAKGSQARAEKFAAVRAEKVSITSFEGSKTIKLYKKPDTMKGLDMGGLARAKSLKDSPFGRYEMANGLVQYFFVAVDKNGELAMKIETRRETK